MQPAGRFLGGVRINSELQCHSWHTLRQGHKISMIMSTPCYAFRGLFDVDYSSLLQRLSTPELADRNRDEAEKEKLYHLAHAKHRQGEGTKKGAGRVPWPHAARLACAMWRTHTHQAANRTQPKRKQVDQSNHARDEGTHFPNPWLPQHHWIVLGAATQNVDHPAHQQQKRQGDADSFKTFSYVWAHGCAHVNRKVAKQSGCAVPFLFLIWCWPLEIFKLRPPK